MNWINIKNRLPKKETLNLLLRLSDEDKEYIVGYFSEGKFYTPCHEDELWDYEVTDRVTHWWEIWHPDQTDPIFVEFQYAGADFIWREYRDGSNDYIRIRVGRQSEINNIPWNGPFNEEQADNWLKQYRNGK